MSNAAVLVRGDLQLLLEHASRAQKLHEDPHVYFIQQGTTGPIKIGCSTDVRRRFAQLETASSVPLRLIGIELMGGFEREAALHRRFAADRLHGEWFRPSERLLDLAVDSYGGYVPPIV